MAASSSIYVLLLETSLVCFFFFLIFLMSILSPPTPNNPQCFFAGDKYLKLLMKEVNVVTWIENDPSFLHDSLQGLTWGWWHVGGWNIYGPPQETFGGNTSQLMCTCSLKPYAEVSACVWLSNRGVMTVSYLHWSWRSISNTTVMLSRTQFLLDALTSHLLWRVHSCKGLVHLFPPPAICIYLLLLHR